MPSQEKRPQNSRLASYLKYSHVGLQFFLSVGLPTGAGIWADRRLGTGVLLTILGLVLGFSAGTYSLYREVFSSAKPPGERRPPDDRSGGAADRPGRGEDG